jgi:hypothetical protein
MLHIRELKALLFHLAACLAQLLRLGVQVRLHLVEALVELLYARLQVLDRLLLDQ